MSRVPWWVAVVAATAVSAGVGAAAAAAGHVEYKAEAKVVVQGKGGPTTVRPLLPNLRELATSSILAGNVHSTLRLPGSADNLRTRLHASVPPSSEVIVLSVTDRKRDRALQIAQEAAVVFTQLVHARFSSLNATILDPAHVVDTRGRHFVRDPLIGAAIGLVVALAAVLALGRGPVLAPTDERLAARERELRERIDLVGRRERELARRAGEVARRERAAGAREGKTRAAEARAAEAREAAAREAEAQKARERAAQAVFPVETPQALSGESTRSSLPTLAELERLVQQRRAEFPDRSEEWSDYLFFLRAHTEADGRLSANFSGLVQDVFGDLLG